VCRSRWVPCWTESIRWSPASPVKLLLSLFGDLLAEMVARLADAAAEWPDPVARLKFYVTSTLDSLDQDSDGVLAAQFVVSTHRRLHRTFPEELADAQQPYVDLLRTEIEASVTAGLLHPIDTDWAAWLISELVRSVYQRDAYAQARRPETKEQLWAFCLQALRASRDSPSRTPPSPGPSTRCSASPSFRKVRPTGGSKCAVSFLITTVQRRTLFPFSNIAKLMMSPAAKT
jgi:TetR/AcrR family transcriptional regulator